MKNKLGNTAVVTGLLAIITFAIIAGVYFIYQQSNQPITPPTTQTTIPGTTTPTSLTGKAATVSVKVNDKTLSANNPQVIAPIYLIKTPTGDKEDVIDNKVEGTFIADGTVSTASDRKDISSGINVGDKLWAIATNNTYYGVWKEVASVSAQGEVLDLDVYLISAANTVNISMKENSKSLLSNGTGEVNLSLGANGAEAIDEIKVKVNGANRAFKFTGFFTNTIYDTNNISSINANGISFVRSGTTIGLTKSTINLGRSSIDEQVFMLDTPILITEWQEYILAGLEIKADGVGCVAAGASLPNHDLNRIDFWFLDSNWYKSSLGDSMVYGVETDANTKADVGAGDYQFILNCYAP